VTQVNLCDVNEIERAVVAFAPAPIGGLIVTASPLSDANRDLFAKLAAQHKLPAVYYERTFVAAGGLISYGPDFVDQFRRSAEYVDRILKGEKPADLPVQAPTKYELAINLKTAKVLDAGRLWHTVLLHCMSQQLTRLGQAGLVQALPLLKEDRPCHSRLSGPDSRPTRS
jgi:ABC-type uncharacterized transport system substrate-binding protein